MRRGDSLIEIAAAHGMTLGRLRELNGLPTHGSLIKVGQTLLVEIDSTATVHVVAEGETLSEIARAHGLSVGELRKLNGIAKRNSM